MSVHVKLHGYLFPGDADGQFVAPPPTCPCDTITFECTVAGNTSGVTWWRLNGGSSSCTLLHRDRDTSVTSTCNNFTAMFENTSATSFPTSLSGTATLMLDGTLVECLGPTFPGNVVGSSIVQIIG